MPSRWLGSSKPVPPYSKLAGIYDFVMQHVPYDEWAGYLHHLFEMADLRVHNVLDIACGTGSLMLELANKGYSVSGFDSSKEMAALAAEKLAKAGKPGRAWSGSMTEFALRRRFDAVVYTYDSLNYCQEIAECAQVFTRVAAVLEPGGVFVFDVTTQSNSKRHFRNYYDKEGTPEFEYIRQSQYDTRTNTQVNEFLIRWRNDGESYREFHSQQIYRLSEICGAIPARFFSLSGPFDGFSTRPGNENSERVTFLLKRKPLT